MTFGRIAFKTGPRYRDIPKSTRPAVLPPISERRFQQQVVEFARQHKWRQPYHTWNSMHSTGGFPDLVTVRGKRLLFAEIKNERGKLTREQEEWLEDLSYTGAEVYVWRPSDWNEVMRVLR